MKNKRLSNMIKKISKEFESRTGFDLMALDEVKDSESFKVCLKINVSWLRDWAEEEARHFEKYIY